MIEPTRPCIPPGPGFSANRSLPAWPPSSPTPSDDADYYGSELDDWLFEDEGDLLGLLLTLPTTRPAGTSSPPASPSDTATPALPVYAVFASSSRAPVVPSTADANATEEPAKAKPLELIVAPFGVGAKPPHPAQEGKAFDPRCACCCGLHPYGACDMSWPAS